MLESLSNIDYGGRKPFRFSGGCECRVEGLRKKKRDGLGMSTYPLKVSARHLRALVLQYMQVNESCRGLGCSGRHTWSCISSLGNLCLCDLRELRGMGTGRMAKLLALLKGLLFWRPPAHGSCGKQMENSQFHIEAFHLFDIIPETLTSIQLTHLQFDRVVHHEFKSLVSI